MSLIRKFRDIQKLPDWLFYLPAKFLLLCRHIMRTEIEDPFGQIPARDMPAVVVIWHNRLLFFPVMFALWERRHTVAVISASRDGQYLADICRQWGVEAVRGSSAKKSVQVMTGAMRSILERGMYVVFTPDGPRGPRYTMSRGPIRIASETGVRIVPIAVNYSSYWELKSWDKFRIPKPWAKVTLRLGESIRIPKGIPEEDMDQWRDVVRRKLNEISEVTDEMAEQALKEAEERAARKAAKKLAQQ